MIKLEEVLKVTVWTKDGNTVQIDGDDLQVKAESREEPVRNLSDIDLNESAKKVADSLRTTHRARRRHGSETIFNKNIIDSAKKTLNKFGK